MGGGRKRKQIFDDKRYYIIAQIKIGRERETGEKNIFHFGQLCDVHTFSYNLVPPASFNCHFLPTLVIKSWATSFLPSAVSENDFQNTWKSWNLFIFSFSIPWETNIQSSSSFVSKLLSPLWFKLFIFKDNSVFRKRKKKKRKTFCLKSYTFPSRLSTAMIRHGCSHWNERVRSKFPFIFFYFFFTERKEEEYKKNNTERYKLLFQMEFVCHGKFPHTQQQ